MKNYWNIVQDYAYVSYGFELEKNQYDIKLIKELLDLVVSSGWKYGVIKVFDQVVVAPGVALLGCTAGLVNVPHIKGNHNAMLSGKAAAEAAFAAIGAGRSGDELADYEAEVRGGAIGRDLKKVRNVKPLWSKFGLVASLMLGGADMWANTFGLTVLGTLKHGKTDAAATEPAANHKPIDYPKPDGKLSFDRLTNVAFSFTNHDENQPAHLRLKDKSIPIAVNLPKFAEPAQRYCPAGVYEVLGEGADASFRINFLSGPTIMAKAMSGLSRTASTHCSSKPWRLSSSIPSDRTRSSWVAKPLARAWGRESWECSSRSWRK